MPPLPRVLTGEPPSHDVASLKAEIMAINQNIVELRQIHQTIHTKSSHEIYSFAHTLQGFEQKQRDLTSHICQAKMDSQTQTINELTAETQLLHSQAAAREPAPSDGIELTYIIKSENGSHHVVDTDGTPTR